MSTDETPDATNHPSMTDRVASRRAKTPAPATQASLPKAAPPVRGQTPGDHISRDSQRTSVAGDLLFDPGLSSLADLLLDLERARIAAENRLRQLTRDVPDKDGLERGFGLTDSHPSVIAQGAILQGLRDLEHQADLDLRRSMRRHPLGAWVKSQRGVGDRMAARLLGCIGDPYWNTLHNRPRTPSELWAYCGLHTLPSGQGTVATRPHTAAGSDFPADHHLVDTQRGNLGGDSDSGSQAGFDAQGPRAAAQTSDPSRPRTEAQPVLARVAAKRRKGQRANWSTAAKMRAYLIAEKTIQLGNVEYRAIYDARRAHTAVTHPDWAKGHSHNDALRIVSKELLKDLWREARRLHGVAEDVAA